MSNNNMADIKVGDKIVISNGARHAEPYRIETVVELTKTQLKTAGGQKYMRVSGNNVGGSNSFFSDMLSHSVSAEEAEKRNANWREENKAKMERRYVRDYAWHLVSDDKIARIKSILDEKS